MVQQNVEDSDSTVAVTESPPQQQPSTENKNLEPPPSRQGRKRERSPENEMNIDVVDNDDGDGKNMMKMKKQRLSRSLSRGCSRSVRPLHVVLPGEGLRDSAQKKKAMKLAKKAVKKRNKAARRGEADRVIPTLKPKHLYSGKRGKGKTHHR